MIGTIYTIHSANDHSIIATAAPENLQHVVATVATAISSADKTRRAYVHNGRGIIAAGLCRAGIWHDATRAEYMRFEAKAAAERKAEGYPLDAK